MLVEKWKNVDERHHFCNFGICWRVKMKNSSQHPLSSSLGWACIVFGGGGGLWGMEPGAPMARVGVCSYSEVILYLFFILKQEKRSGGGG